jgi:hypothetical protein
VWTNSLEEPLLTRALLDICRHAVVWIDLALLGLPEVMGHEFQRQGFRRRPGEGRAGCSERPGLKVGKIGGERTQRILPHALIDEVAERLDFLVCQDLASLSRRSIGRTDAMVSSCSARIKTLWLTADAGKVFCVMGNVRY